MTNSLISNVMLNSKAPTPEVGMGATIAMWTDRHAATIIGVTMFKTGKRAGQVETIEVQRDKAIRVDKNGMSDAQHYEYSPDPDAPRQIFHLNRKGQFMLAGCNEGPLLIVGVRDEHFDFTF